MKHLTIIGGGIAGLASAYYAVKKSGGNLAITLLEQADYWGGKIITDRVTDAIPGKLVLKRGVTPPENTDRDVAGFRITYTAGYGSNPSDIPQGIKEGLKLWVVDIYENRVITDDPPPEAKPMLDIHRVLMI